MFSSVCTSVIRNVARNNRRSILSRRTAFRNGKNPLCTATSSNTKPEINRDDPKLKRVKLSFQKADGTVITKIGVVGETIHDMIDALDPKRLEFPGYGVCGGTLTCSTCHVIMDEKDFDIPKDKPTDDELDLVAYAPDVCDTSRLSCCIHITEEMEGMVFKLPSATENQQDS